MNFKSNLVKYILDINNSDAFLIVSDVNRFWLTEFESSFGFVLATRQKIYLFLDKRYYQKALDTITNTDIEIVCFTSKNQILEKMSFHNVLKLMVEKEYFSFEDYLFYRNSINSIVCFSSDFLRIKKTPQEIEYTQKACDIVCEAMNFVQEQNLVGYTEIEVANLITTKMLELGATKNSFDPIVASGVNGAYPHHKPTNKVVEENEFVTIDAGCIYKGYCSDLTRTFPIGFPNQKLIEAYKVVFDANYAGIQAAKYKVLGKDVDKVCRDHISSTEFKDYFIHSTGHGVGINVHELPNTSPTYEFPLENNCICTIEPGIYIPGLGGIRIEDMVLVQTKETICMTTKAKKWIFN